jgi:hypothetical protein
MRMDIAERDIETFKQQQFGIMGVAKSKSASKLSEEVWSELTLPSGTWSKGNEVRVPDIGKFAVLSMESADRLGLQVTDRNLSLNANLSDIPLSMTTALLKPPPGLSSGPPAVPINSGTNARGVPALPEPGMKPLSLASLFTASSPHMAPSRPLLIRTAPISVSVLCRLKTRVILHVGRIRLGARERQGRRLAPRLWSRRWVLIGHRVCCC